MDANWSRKNAVDLIPARTVTAERQMVAYLSGQKLLYSSDLFQKAHSGEFFLPQTLSEAVDLVHKNKLDVKTDVGMHLGPMPWKEITEAVAAARGIRKPATSLHRAVPRPGKTRAPEFPNVRQPQRIRKRWFFHMDLESFRVRKPIFASNRELRVTKA